MARVRTSPGNPPGAGERPAEPLPPLPPRAAAQMPELGARAGDVLVVTYPEVAVQIAPYTTVRVGGLTYSRQLVQGENVGEQYALVYEFLRARAERDAAAKVAAWRAEYEEAQARDRKK